MEKEKEVKIQLKALQSDSFKRRGKKTKENHRNQRALTGQL